MDDLQEVRLVPEKSLVPGYLLTVSGQLYDPHGQNISSKKFVVFAQNISRTLQVKNGQISIQDDRKFKTSTQIHVLPRGSSFLAIPISSPNVYLDSECSFSNHQTHISSDHIALSLSHLSNDAVFSYFQKRIGRNPKLYHHIILFRENSILGLS